MRAGKDNVRSVRQGGTDPQLWAMAGLLGIVVATVGTIRLGLAAQAAVTGQDQVIPGNPITAAVQVIRGELQWTSVATAAAIGLWVVIGAGVFVVLWVRTAKPKARVDAAAKWMAPRRDIESMSRAAAEKSAEKWLPAGMAQTHPGLRLGRVPRTSKGLWSSWEDLYLIIFGPRMGKTTTQVIPAIVDAPGPVITTSNKRDIIDDTIGVTAARGQVWAFDPQRIAAGFEQRPWYYDPLSLIRRDPAVMDSASMELADIFRSAARGEDSGGDAFFSDGGRDLLSRLLLAAALDGRPIGEVFRWANDDSDRTPVGILARFPEWEQQAAALKGTYNITEKTRSGLFSQAAQMAAPLGRREALKWVTPTVGASEFVPEDFVRSAHDTLYVLSKEGADNAAALTTALTAAVMKAAEEYGEANGGRLPVPLVAPLDEAANVVRWPQLPRLYSHYGSRSIILMTILQSYAQGVSVWGEEGMEALWSASAILMYGGGVRDERMLQKLEALIGDAEEQTRSVSRSADGRSVSQSVREKKILTVAELASLEAGRAVVFASKRRPIIAQLEPWWERSWPREIKERLGADAPVVEEEAR